MDLGLHCIDSLVGKELRVFLMVKCFHMDLQFPCTKFLGGERVKSFPPTKIFSSGSAVTLYKFCCGKRMKVFMLQNVMTLQFHCPHVPYLSVIYCSHCMASNPSITQYPPGVQLPHEPGPSTGELPPGEGCYNCNHDFGDLPLSRPYRGRSKRSVAERMEVEEADLDEVVNLYKQRLVTEEAMSVGEVVRSRRSVDPYYNWHLNRVSRRMCVCVFVCV